MLSAVENRGPGILDTVCRSEPSTAESRPMPRYDDPAMCAAKLHSLRSVAD